MHTVAGKCDSQFQHQKTAEREGVPNSSRWRIGWMFWSFCILTVPMISVTVHRIPGTTLYYKKYYFEYLLSARTWNWEMCSHDPLWSISFELSPSQMPTNYYSFMLIVSIIFWPKEQFWVCWNAKQLNPFKSGRNRRFSVLTTVYELSPFPMS